MKHSDRLTLIMFRFLKCSKSQTWLHIYEAKMHLLFILGSGSDLKCLVAVWGNFGVIKNLFRVVQKISPPFP